MTVLSVRKERIRLMISRVLHRVDNPQRFSTHEVLNLVQEMSRDDLRGIPFAASILRRIKNPVTFSMYLRGHPEIDKHEEGIINISAYGEGRVRSGLWTIKGDSSR